MGIPLNRTAATIVAFTLSVVTPAESAFGQELRRVLISEELDRIAASADQRVGVELAIGSRLFGRLAKREKARFDVIDPRGQQFTVHDEEVVAFLDLVSGQRTALVLPPPHKTKSAEHKVWIGIAVGLGALIFCVWQLGGFAA